MTAAVQALIERFDHLRNSGVCSPTTRSLLDDAQVLLAALSTPPADDVREALAEIERWKDRPTITRRSHMDQIEGLERLRDLLAAEVRRHEKVAATVDNLRFVNSAVVLAALAQMEEVAADRQQLQSVKLSILRRRIASLQGQIENQAAEVHPYGTVTDAEAKELTTIHAIAQATGMSVESAFDALADIRKAAREVHP